MEQQDRFATVKLSGRDQVGTVDISLPAGKFDDLVINYLELDTVRDYLAKFRERGCPACNSGIDIHIRRDFEEVFEVDLATRKITR